MRKQRTAGELKTDDYIHDTLAPVRVTDVKKCGSGSVRVEGVFHGTTRMGAVHPADRQLDVTRIED
ncbi:hypothetical protein ACFFR3_46265 [Nonomuraea salmonea]|uniref:Uncharacterized protein n=1 Tax=Nonomuraea salmonea TaxID=46181 RepID=A0ABV5P2Z3_9ACTN